MLMIIVVGGGGVVLESDQPWRAVCVLLVPEPAPSWLWAHSRPLPDRHTASHASPNHVQSVCLPEMAQKMEMEIFT